jgi:hypothetical protein
VDVQRDIAKERPSVHSEGRCKGTAARIADIRTRNIRVESRNERRSVNGVEWVRKSLETGGICKVFVSLNSVPEFCLRTVFICA